MDEAIRRVLAADPRVAYALVFGSFATGHSSPFSDLDIAIGLKPRVDLDHRAIGRLTTQLEQGTGRTVDLVVLDEAPLALAYRIFRDGRLLYEADRAARVRKQALAVLEYLDFKPFEQRCTRAVLDAATHG
jgi:predicted nucleotidyltransferase